MSENSASISRLKESSIGSVLLIVSMLVMVMIPLPPLVLDFLFTFNISLSLVILMVCLYVSRPLEFNVFPTILLITTLLRLTLNVASTRIVLLHGHEGTAAAGKVIQAFGEVVIGGNFIVGLIIFVILMIINFVVVTKGAGRVSEVSARFTLDAMPGKQMAVDADLNAGVINQEEAKKRRQEIIMESDFYGSMDGASKFVRGDAIAGLLILVINLLGGIVIGVIEHHLSFINAAHTFSILTIGDGLVAQIPSLLLSISAAIMVTRVSNEADISKQTLLQLFGNYKPVFLSSCILTVLAVIPEMPHVSLFMFSLFGLTISYFLANKKSEMVTEGLNDKEAKNYAPGTESADLNWEDVARCDRIALEIGYGLIPLIGTKREGLLVSRIKGIRKKLSQKLGFLIPTIHIKDDFNLSPNIYRIYLKGVQIAESQVYAEKLLAITAGNIQQSLPGLIHKDPTFGLDCYWISEHQKQYAEGLGYTVVDASTVIATHLNQVIYTNAGSILGYEEVEDLINRLTNTNPKLAEVLTSASSGVPTTVIFTVLQKLLTSEIPIVDFCTIAETMIDQWSKIKDLEVLISVVRIALKQMIIYSICGNLLELPVSVLNNELTHTLLKSIQLNNSINEKTIAVDPGLTDKIYSQLLSYIKQCEENSIPAIFLLHDDLRALIERLFKPNLPHVHFLSFAEIPNTKQIKIVERIG